MSDDCDNYMECGRQVAHHYCSECIERDIEGPLREQINKLEERVGVLGRLKEIVRDACASDEELVDYVTWLLEDDEYRKQKCDYLLTGENSELKDRNQALEREVEKLRNHESELVNRLHEMRKQTARGE